MRIISLPDELEHPPILRDFGEAGMRRYARAQERWLRHVRAWVRAYDNTGDPLIGEEAAFPVADGYARYLVAHVKPMALVHLPLGDLYRLPAYAERGLREADVRANVRMQRGLRAMLAEARP